MSARRFLLSRAAGICALPLAILTWSCSDANEATAPSVLMARAAAGGGLSVSSVVPDSSERGATLDITVNGSGFSQASTVKFERAGVPANGITVNTTKYVTSKKLIANVTIAAAADTGKYDVAVSDGDRKGIGVEMFTVTYQIAELGIIGGTWSRAYSINNQGEVVGASCTGDCLSTAFYWSEATGQLDLGGLAGYSRSAAYAINNRGEVFGEVECRAADPGCGGLSKKAIVRWDLENGSWTISPVAGCSVVTVPLSEHGEKILINSSEQCVRRTTSYSLVVQTLSGGAVVSEESLPSLYADAINGPYAISDAGMVAGWVSEVLQRYPDGSATGGPAQPVLWYRHASQGWVVLRLGFPSGDLRAWATDVAEPDATGRVRVTGYTEWSGSTTGDVIRPLRWTLQADGAGGWQVTSTEVLGTITRSKNQNKFWAAAVNVSGDVVGLSGQYVSTASPILWSISGGTEILPGLAGGTQGRAIDINNRGWIVGAVWDSKNNCDRAAIWRQQ